ncbi:DUF4393 domain-containing protein [Bacillus sp. 3255]|uniref:DUF4393 domain-containing protein n=1 Tax=Bacillus sp. 3255 TaxID=2817904 RepID=UPI002862A1F3|nr:DUF4393 domain-containing protein [Bacillus sp. 3255]MDR6883580.1 hypothetical protein [Bacillus sp. 3255]
MLDPETLRLLINKAPDLNEVYKDLAQPSFKKAGIALETVMDFCNTTMLPLRLLNAKANHYFNKSIEGYGKELENTDESRITPVPLEIGVPILEKLTYTTNESLRSLFIKLLAKASCADTIQLAHPSFIKVIDSISSDEANILNFIAKNPVYGRLHVIKHRLISKDETFRYISYHTTKIEFIEEVGLLFPENCAIYLDNLVALGLVEFNYLIDAVPQEEYDNIDALFRDKHADQIKRDFNSEIHDRIDYEKGTCEITQLGSMFIEACILDNTSQAHN